MQVGELKIGIFDIALDSDFPLPELPEVEKIDALLKSNDAIFSALRVDGAHSVSGMEIR